MDETTRFAAAGIFAACCALLLAFQLGLILGRPWGDMTLGGRWQGVLPLHARMITGLSMVLVVAFVLTMLDRSGWIALVDMPDWASWAVVAYCALGCVANAATPSRRERRLWLPVVSVMLASSLIITLS